MWKKVSSIQVGMTYGILEHEMLTMTPVALMKATHRQSMDVSSRKEIAEKASKLYSRDHDEPLYINVDTGAAMRREDLPQDSEIID